MRFTRRSAGMLMGMTVLGCLAAPGAASASSVSVVRSQAPNPKGTDVTKTITYRAAVGEVNRLTVSFVGATGPEGSATRRYSVVDTGASISVGAGCVRVTVQRATCSIADETLNTYDSLTDALNARLGNGNDRAFVPVDISAVPPLQAMDVTLDGGSGSDSLSVPKAFATLRGGSGNDRLTGSDRTDSLDGGGGKDRLKGGESDDRLQCRGSRGCSASGGRGDDEVFGGSGNDRLNGDSGKDSLRGGRGKDRLTGGSGRDKLSGGSGRDRLLSRDHSRDRVNGGSGRDRARVDGHDVVKSVEKLRRS